MSKRIEHKVGDATFFIRRFDPKRALRTFGDLQKSLLAPVLAIVDARTAEGTVDVGAFAAGLQQLSSSLDGATLASIADRILDPEFVSVRLHDGDEAQKLSEGALNLALDDDFTEYTVLIATAFAVQFGPFLTHGPSRIGAVLSSIRPRSGASATT